MSGSLRAGGASASLMNTAIALKLSNISSTEDARTSFSVQYSPIVSRSRLIRASGVSHLSTIS